MLKYIAKPKGESGKAVKVFIVWIMHVKHVALGQNNRKSSYKGSD